MQAYEATKRRMQDETFYKKCQNDDLYSNKLNRQSIYRLKTNTSYNWKFCVDLKTIQHLELFLFENVFVGFGQFLQTVLNFSKEIKFTSIWFAI